MSNEKEIKSLPETFFANRFGRFFQICIQKHVHNILKTNSRTDKTKPLMLQVLVQDQN